MQSQAKGAFVDEADQGPGPRDPEIPHQATDEDAPHGASAVSAVFAESAPEEPDWTRSLTTISVVAPRPRPPVEQADEGGTASDETAEEASAETSEPISQPISQPTPEPPAPASDEDRDAERAAAAEAATDGSAPDTALLLRVHALLTQDESDLVAPPPGAAVAEDESAAPADAAAEAPADTPAEPAEAASESASESDVLAELLAPFADASAPGEAATEAADPDTALLKPVSGGASAKSAGDPDTALLKPVDDIDDWVSSLGSRPVELAEGPPGTADDGGDGPGDPDEDKETVPPRRRFINPWLGGAGAVVLLLAGAMTIQNPFTMATSERVAQSDVQRLSDPEPPSDAGPVNGSVPENLELPPVTPAAAPGVSPVPSAPSSAVATVPVPVSTPPTGAGLVPAPSVVGANGIPQIVLKAYQDAALYTGKADPRCKLRWELLGAIGRVESSHANSGQVSTDGTALSPILGPRLDGSRETKAIPDTDQGALDFDREFDRAVGPMQFIPSSWRVYAMDGNKDGRKDPQNVFDAALTAARYLCAGERDLSTADGLDRAIFSYNQSPEYVRSVKAWMQFYMAGVRPIAQPSAPPPAPATTKPPAPATSKPAAAPSSAAVSPTSPKPASTSPKPGG